MKEYLSQKGISYAEHSVAEEADGVMFFNFNQNLKDMIKKSGTQFVPVIIIDDEVVVGFDQGRLDNLLP